MTDLPTRIDHGREVVDGSKLDEVILVVVFSGVTVRLPYTAEDLDGQPLHSVRDLARQDAEDAIESARFEVTCA